jgi:hypothetical protein
MGKFKTDKEESSVQIVAGQQNEKNEEENWFVIVATFTFDLGRQMSKSDFEFRCVFDVDRVIVYSFSSK